MGKIVRQAWGESRITEERKQELAALAEHPDSEIDFSDIPELSEESFKNAIPNPYYRRAQEQIILGIDSDVLAWLKEQGDEGYQSRMNGLLRRLMLEDLRDKRKRA